MPISLHALEAFTTTAEAEGQVFATGAATAALPAAGTFEAGGAIFFYGSGTLTMISHGEPVPGASADGAVYVAADITAGGTQSAELDSTLRVFGDGWCGTGAICDGAVYVRGEAIEALEMLFVDSAAVITPYPWTYSLGGGSFERVVDSIGLNAATRGHPQINVLDSIVTERRDKAKLDGASRTAEILRAFGVDANVVYIVSREHLAVTGVEHVDFQAIARVIETLLVEGAAVSVLDALSKIADALAALAVADTLQLADTADVLALTAAAGFVYTAIERVVDSGVLFSVDRQSLSIMVRESVVIGDTPMTAAEIFALIRDGVGCFGRMRLDTGEHIAWTVNTESSGVTTYTDFPFNSFAMIGDRYFGMTSVGVHALEADDDDGVPIAARLRVGLTDMGTRLLKGVTEAYIGFTSGNKLLLRTITPNPSTGVREAAHYEMKSVGNATLAPQRFETGRGVKAVDWDFELENVDGADFDLYSVEFLPVKMSRRTRS